MSLVTLTMTLLTGFVLLAPVAMAAILVAGGVARRPATSVPELRIPRSACGCGDSGCGLPALSRAA